MRESRDDLDTPRLDFDAWRDLIRSNCGSRPEVAEPNAFIGWMRPTSVCGVAAAVMKFQCGLVGTDLGRHAYRSERTCRDIRLSGVDYYYAIFQVAGRSTLIQNDQAVQLAVGDVALLDAARPAAYFSENGSGQWRTLYLPRQLLVSNLGVEPQGGLFGCGRTRAARLLFDLIWDADKPDESMFTQVTSYMQLAVYDLLGALFAPSDPRPTSRQSDKLFARIRGIIKDGYADPDFSPREAAVEAGISLRYLQKLFTERGSTFGNCVYSLRLEHAARLLHRRASLQTSQPISEIAYACGFRDYTHFARKFRHRFGYSPSAHFAVHGQLPGMSANGGESPHDV
jgi:AraC-like DNA-binding protein